MKGFVGVAMLLAVVLAGCATTAPDRLTVTSLDPVTYRCEDGTQIVAYYMNLSDESLPFVRLVFPDGQVWTLPQMPSASGARFTDDRRAIWWEKGGKAFLQVRDSNGDWVDLYADCRALTKE